MNSEKKSVMFDIDDTLGQFSPAFSCFMSEKFPRFEKDHHKNWITYDLCEHYDCDREAIRDALLEFEANGWMSEIKVNENIRDILLNMKMSGLRIDIVTARGWMENGRKITKNWLSRHSIPYDSLTIIPLGEEKISYLNDTLIAAFEDATHHAVSIAQAFPESRVYLCNYPWNEADTGLPDNVKRLSMKYFTS